MMTYLSNVGAILAGIALIMVADYWIIRKRRIVFQELYNPTGIYRFWSGGINWLAIIAAALSMILGSVFINYGGTFISAISGFLIYLALMKIFSNVLLPIKKSLTPDQFLHRDNKVNF